MSDRSPVEFPGSAIRRLTTEEWCRDLADDIADEEWPERAYTRTLVLNALREAASTIEQQRSLVAAFETEYIRMRAAIHEHERAVVYAENEGIKHGADEALWATLTQPEPRR